MGVPKALDLSLLVGYLFVRSFLFMLKLCPCPRLIYTRSPAVSSLFHRVTLSLSRPPGPLNGAVIAAEKRGTLCPATPCRRRKKLMGAFG